MPLVRQSTSPRPTTPRAMILWFYGWEYWARSPDFGDVAFPVANNNALLLRELFWVFAVVLCRMWTQLCKRQEWGTQPGSSGQAAKGRFGLNGKQSTSWGVSRYWHSPAIWGFNLGSVGPHSPVAEHKTFLKMVQISEQGCEVEHSNERDSFIQMAFERPKQFHNSSGKLVPVLSHPYRKKSIPRFSQGKICVRLCPLPLVFSLCNNKKGLVSSSVHLQVFIPMDMIHLIILFRLNSLCSFTLLLWERCSSLLFILLAFFWTLSSSSVSLIYWWAQHWTCGLSAELRARITSLYLLQHS